MRSLAKRFHFKVEIIEVDIRHSKNADFTQLGVRQKWLQFISRGEADALLVAPPCSTFSRAHWANDDGPLPLRSSMRPRGFAWNSPKRKLKPWEGSVLADFSYDATEAQLQFSDQVAAMEQPEDLGATKRPRIQGCYRLLRQLNFGSESSSPTAWSHVPRPSLPLILPASMSVHCHGSKVSLSLGAQAIPTTRQPRPHGHLHFVSVWQTRSCSHLLSFQLDGVKKRDRQEDAASHEDEGLEGYQPQKARRGPRLPIFTIPSWTTGKRSGMWVEPLEEEWKDLRASLRQKVVKRAGGEAEFGLSKANYPSAGVSNVVRQDLNQVCFIFCNICKLGQRCDPHMEPHGHVVFADFISLQENLKSEPPFGKAAALSSAVNATGGMLAWAGSCFLSPWMRPRTLAQGATLAEPA